MTITNEMRQTAEASLSRFMEIARERLNYDHPAPSITWDVRGTCGGRADFRGNRIRLNPVLFIENVKDYEEQTIPHELAHIMEYKIHGCYQRRGRKRSLHGNRWKAIMRALGVAPERCHSMDTTNAKTRQQRRFTYYCACQSFQISTTMHNRILRGQSRHCPSCKHEITREKGGGAKVQITRRRRRNRSQDLIDNFFDF